MKHCSICNEPQVDSPSGMTCANGHGGVTAVEDMPLNAPGSKDFEYYITDSDCRAMHVKMVNGMLIIDDSEYENESSPETYALVIEVAKHRGLLT